MNTSVQLSDFERVALESVLSKLPHAGAVDFSATMVRVVSREDTGVGFYTVLDQLPGCDFRLVARTANPPTAIVRHADLPNNGIVTVWPGESGRIEGLEAVSFGGEPWPADMSGFSIDEVG